MEDRPPPVSAPAHFPSEPWSSPRARRTNRQAAIVIALLPVVVASLIVAASLFAPSSAPSHPDRWDDEVVALVEFVERTRELPFEHPVHIEHLEEDEFRDLLADDSGSSDPLARADAELEAARLRALGLAEGPIDLLAASDDLSFASVSALYDPVRKRILVRGATDGQLDPSTRLTLVHELVHALQDQHFDLGRLQSPAFDAEQHAAALALVEGDARVVEDRYYRSLSRAEQRVIEESAAAYAEAVERAEVIDVVGIAADAPYTLGPSLVAALHRRGGYTAVDRAFADLPHSEEHVLAPIRFAARHDPVRSVNEPEIRTSDRERWRDSFGALQLFVMLSERIDAHEALAAADGWGGGRWVTFSRIDDGECLRAVLTGDTDRDTREIHHALRAWSQRGALGASSVTRSGREVLLSACDPGAHEQILTGLSGDAFWLPVTRAELFRAYLDDGLPLEFAWCAADDVIHNSTLDDLIDEGGTYFTSPELMERTEAAGARCADAVDAGV